MFFLAAQLPRQLFYFPLRLLAFSDFLAELTPQLLQLILIKVRNIVMELFRRFVVEDKDDAFLHEVDALADLISNDFRLCGYGGAGYFFEKSKLPCEEIEHFAVEALVLLALFKHNHL